MVSESKPRRKINLDLAGSSKHSFVCTTLTDEYNLIKEAKFQPVVNVDDLLYLTYHTVAISNIWFPTARSRQQHSTLRKMMTATAARPGTLVESTGYIQSKDLELYMIKNPEVPTCKVLVLRV
ncbi:hypothetical protein V8E54_010878 [Elaphomyces granulatus]